MPATPESLPANPRWLRRERTRDRRGLGSGVEEGDLAVVHEIPVAVGGEDPAHADDAVPGQLRGAQRAHARAPEHRDARVERGEDLVVPDRRGRVEEPVDERDGERSLGEHGEDVAGARGREDAAGDDAARLRGVSKKLFALPSRNRFT